MRVRGAVNVEYIILVVVGALAVVLGLQYLASANNVKLSDVGSAINIAGTFEGDTPDVSGDATSTHVIAKHGNSDAPYYFYVDDSPDSYYGPFDSPETDFQPLPGSHTYHFTDSDGKETKTVVIDGGSPAQNGTAAEPYLVYDMVTLNNVRNNMASYWKQICNVNASASDFDGAIGLYNTTGNGWNPISPFSGNYNGNNYDVSNIHSRMTDAFSNTGMFGRVTGGGSITNLGITNVHIVSGGRVAGLAGENNGAFTVTNTHISGNITGTGAYAGGLFGAVQNNPSTISDCLVNANITCDTVAGRNVGGLVAWAQNTSTLFKDCTVNGTINGGSVVNQSFVGGGVGHTSGLRIDNCTINANVSGTDYIGGMAGYLGSGGNTFSNSTVNGDITGGSAGGFIGNDGSNILGVSTVTNCSATGDVTGRKAAGFVVGSQYVNYADCSATGNINGGWWSGGFAAAIFAGNISRCSATGNVTVDQLATTGAGGFAMQLGSGAVNISDCYARGNVSGSDQAAGFVATWNSTGSMNNCYSTGRPNGLLASKGFINVGSTNVNNCFFDYETAGTSSTSAGTAKTTAEMKNHATFTDWDFATIWETPVSSYPVLQ